MIVKKWPNYLPAARLENVPEPLEKVIQTGLAEWEASAEETVKQMQDRK